MTDSSIARTAEIQTPEGWQSCSLGHLQPGQRFRVLKADGSVVRGSSGACVFVAHSRPHEQHRGMRVRERFARVSAANVLTGV